jgi:hypothetical protein
VLIVCLLLMSVSDSNDLGTASSVNDFELISTAASRGRRALGADSPRFADAYKVEGALGADCPRFADAYKVEGLLRPSRELS